VSTLDTVLVLLCTVSCGFSAWICHVSSHGTPRRRQRVHVWARWNLCFTGGALAYFIVTALLF
jgi:hypothetical protein